jgi:acetyl-CoA acetyltransferase
MTSRAIVAGVGMTEFGKHLERSLKSLAGEAIGEALRDAGLEAGDIQAAWMGNSAAGVITGQVCVRGQAVLRPLGIGKIPVINVENACATAATAFQQAAVMVENGAFDIALACGFEKLYSEDKRKTFAVFSGAIDVEAVDEVMTGIAREKRKANLPDDTAEAGASRSLFVDLYVGWALKLMREYGVSQEHLAQVSSKNSYHGSLNPKAQYRDEISVEEVLQAREVAWPLTLPMCSPIGDGAAAALLVSEDKARELGIDNPVRVEAHALFSGWDYQDDEPGVAEVAAAEFYKQAGIGPEDLDLVELHDASAASELLYYHYLGLCPQDQVVDLIESGATRLGGRIPVNTSGGLMRKGHPIGATGVAQIVELVTQLRGRAGSRQVEGARLALAENGGGFIGRDAAALALTLLSR